MFIRKLAIYLVFFIYTPLACSSNNTGFDEICSIYTEAINSSMPKEQRSEYVFDNIAKRVNSIDALEAHSGVFNLDITIRYSVFKKAAEMSLKRSWDCDAVRRLMS